MKERRSGTAASSDGNERMGSSAARQTATFEPYHWEAYNQIVRPDRFDWYLITRWLPDLGPDGFTLLKTLRNLCYFNPREGTLRDTCQITVDELAEQCGMTRSTVYRVLEKNEALRAFVQRLPEAIFVQGQTRRLPPRWRVCMDCPIHPIDFEEYDLLRAGRETQRMVDEEEKRKSQIGIYEKRKSQREISGGRKSQNEERKSQNEERKSQIGILSIGTSLPSVSIPSETIPHVPCGGDPPNIPPRGEEEDLWDACLAFLAGQVNLPTLKTHLETARIVSIGPDTVTVGVGSEFSRTYLEKRFASLLAEALRTALNRPVSVLFTVRGK